MATSSPNERNDPPLSRRAPSLRLRVLFIAAVTLVSTLTIGGLALSNMFENSIEQTIETQLDVYWSELAAAFVLVEGTTPKVAREMSDPRFHAPFGGAYWRIDEAERTLLRSRSLWDQALVRDRPEHLSPRGVAEEQRGPDGSIVYAMTRPVTLTGAEGERTFALTVALDTADMAGLRAEFAGDLARALVLIGLLLFGGAVVQVSFGLYPLGQMRRQLARVHRGTALRLEGVFPDEVAPLVDDLNGLLARQEEQVRRARARAGDLAHGLKTPLTILRGLERRRREAGDLESADLLRQQVEAMRTHVERELSRARTHGAAAAAGTLTDARLTVDRLIGLFARAPRGPELAWIDELAPDLRLRMDPDDFGEVIGNLLDNARKAAATTVRISAESQGAGVRIAIDDDGPGIAAERVAHLLSRGASEDPTAEGTGLGLAIVTAVLEEYGLTLDLARSPAGGTRAAFGPVATARRRAVADHGKLR